MSKKINKHERIILDVLYLAWRPLNTKEIAEKANISWATAKKYLKRLYRKGHLRTKKKGNTRYWRIKSKI